MGDYRGRAANTCFGLVDRLTFAAPNNDAQYNQRKNAGDDPNQRDVIHFLVLLFSGCPTSTAGNNLQPTPLGRKWARSIEDRVHMGLELLAWKACSEPNTLDLDARLRR